MLHSDRRCDEGVIATERIQRLLDPGFATELDSRSLDDLRAMHDECNEVENALSYHRRLAQARIEILEAEHARRARGGIGRAISSTTCRGS